MENILKFSEIFISWVVSQSILLEHLSIQKLKDSFSILGFIIY